MIEELSKDLQELQQEREKTREELLMYNGAIQYVERKINEISAKNINTKNEKKK